MKLQMKVWLMGAISVLIGLTGCSSDGNGDKTQKVENNPYDSQTAEVIFYSNNGDTVENFDLRFGDALRKKFPNYTITYIRSETGKSLPQMITAGNRFDIFFQTIGNFETNAFPVAIEYDMSELISKHKVDLSRFEPSIIEAMKQASGGKMYALPIFTSNLVLYYNKSLFNKFGVAYPKDGATWNEIMELNRLLTRVDGGTQYLGFTHSPSHTLRMNQLSIPSADLKTNKSTINTDERWKTFYQTFFADPFKLSGYEKFKTDNKRIPNNVDFSNGLVGMYAYQNSYVTTLGREKKVDWDMVAFPLFPQQPGIGSQSYPSYFGITKMAENKDAVMNVFKYMVSDEFQIRLAREQGLLPVLKNESIIAQLGADTENKDKHWKAVYFNKLAPIPAKGSYDAALITTYTTFGTNVAMGTLDVNTALRQAEEDANKKITAALAK